MLFSNVQQEKIDINKTFLTYLEYMNETMKNEYTKNIVAKLRSKKDIDIVVEIENYSKTLPITVMIEANIYTRPELNAKKIIRSNDTISVLTHNDENVKIFVYETNKFNAEVSGKAI